MLPPATSIAAQTVKCNQGNPAGLSNATDIYNQPRNGTGGAKTLIICICPTTRIGFFVGNEESGDKISDFDAD